MLVWSADVPQVAARACWSSRSECHGGHPAKQSLFAAWAIHDLEEIVGTRYWRRKAMPASLTVRTALAEARSGATRAGGPC
jgi:hypothetical protein